MNYKIRRRQREDCAAIAHVVTVAWNETYKGIVPDWFLEELKTNEPDRAKKTYDEVNVVIPSNDLINYEEHRDDYYLHGIKFRIARNGDVHVMEWSKVWDQYFVSEDCITEIKSELAENSYYDPCTNILLDYDGPDGW